MKSKVRNGLMAVFAVTAIFTTTACNSNEAPVMTTAETTTFATTTTATTTTTTAETTTVPSIDLEELEAIISSNEELGSEFDVTTSEESDVNDIDETTAETTEEEEPEATINPNEVLVETTMGAVNNPETTTTTTTEATETTLPVTTEESAPSWSETTFVKTMWTAEPCFSRVYAIIGSDAVLAYSAGTEIEVVAKTDSGYYKLDNGSFIHQDYVIDYKPAFETQQTPAAVVTEAPYNYNPSGTTNERGWTDEDQAAYDFAVLFGDTDYDPLDIEPGEGNPNVSWG